MATDKRRKAGRPHPIVGADTKRGIGAALLIDAYGCVSARLVGGLRVTPIHRLGSKTAFFDIPALSGQPASPSEVDGEIARGAEMRALEGPRHTATGTWAECAGQASL